MPFLPPNQQRQSTEGSLPCNKLIMFIKYRIPLFVPGTSLKFDERAFSVTAFWQTPGGYGPAAQLSRRSLIPFLYKKSL